jgi:ComF family protein
MFGCGRCGEAINLDLDLEDARFGGMLAEGFLCRECRLATPEFTRAVSYGIYDGELRGLIRLLKFERVRGVARLLGGRMAQAILQLEDSAAKHLTVIAVPLFKQRERQRGYNQSVLLANEALRHLKQLRPDWKLTAAHSALERRRSTESSFVLSRKGRRRNLRGAFHVTADVRGREVLLVDDILTSGATARECARVLIRAGAAKVWVATLARAQRRFIVRQHEDPGEYVAAWDLPDQLVALKERDFNPAGSPAISTGP